MTYSNEILPILNPYLLYALYFFEAIFVTLFENIWYNHTLHVIAITQQHQHPHFLTYKTYNVTKKNIKRGLPTSTLHLAVVAVKKSEWRKMTTINR